MKYLYILKVGTTFASTKEQFGDFDQWILRFLEKKKLQIKVIDVSHDDKFPYLAHAKGLIITGSHSMVSDELEWSIKLEKYIRKIAKTSIPLLGICYGHQLIAKALGGKSDFNPNGKEIGNVFIKHTCHGKNDPLLHRFPKSFCAYETHYQTVIKPPKKSKILSKNSMGIQAIRFDKAIWGVQFHPEFDKNIMLEYILNQQDDLRRLGFDVDRLIQDTQDCDMSHKILTNFIKMI